MCSVKRTWLPLLTVCCLLAAGCVEGNVSSFLKYEKKDDSFKILEVYSNLRATNKADLDHLESLWQRREAILVNPFDLHLFGRTAYERKGKHKFQIIDMGSAPAKIKDSQGVEKEPEVRVTQVDLDSIKVIPGQFFLNKHRNLSYHHQIIVPGKTLDAILKEVTPLLAQIMADEAEKQIKLTDSEKATPSTWDDVRKQMLDELSRDKSKPPPPQPPSDKVQLWPLELASLRMFIKAGVDKSLKHSRSGDAISLVVPLSKRDCHEVLSTLDLFDETIAEFRKENKPIDADLLVFRKAISVKHVQGEGMQVTVSLSKLPNELANVVDLQPDEKIKRELKMTTASIQGRGIEINKELNIQDVIGPYLPK